MSRLRDTFTPTSETTQILEKMKEKMGMVPEGLRLIALSPNVLAGYTSFQSNLAKGKLTDLERRQISLVVTGYNKCSYCQKAYTFMAKKMNISEEEIQKNLKGESNTPEIASLIKFCLTVMNTQGHVTDADIEAIRKAGFDDEKIVEIIANIAIITFTNYFNSVADTKPDKCFLE